MLNPPSLQNNTTHVVIQQNSRKLLMMDILMSETCWAHKKWNKIASDIKLVFYSSTITMMHGPIYIRCQKCVYHLRLTVLYCFLLRKFQKQPTGGGGVGDNNEWALNLRILEARKFWKFTCRLPEDLSSLIRNGDIERVKSLLWYPTKHWRKLGARGGAVNAPPVFFFFT